MKFVTKLKKNMVSDITKSLKKTAKTQIVTKLKHSELKKKLKFQQSSISDKTQEIFLRH